MDISNHWDCQDQGEWLRALGRYWKYVKPQNEALEREMENLDIAGIKRMTAEEWYEFLLNSYYKWKFTDSLLYAQNSRHLRFADDECGPDRLRLTEELFEFKQELFAFNKSDIREGLRIARRDGVESGLAGGHGCIDPRRSGMGRATKQRRAPAHAL